MLRQRNDTVSATLRGPLGQGKSLGLAQECHKYAVKDMWGEKAGAGSCTSIPVTLCWSVALTEVDERQEGGRQEVFWGGKGWSESKLVWVESRRWGCSAMLGSMPLLEVAWIWVNPLGLLLCYLGKGKCFCSSPDIAAAPILRWMQCRRTSLLASVQGGLCVWLRVQS